jgi:hypothetical protein
MRAADIYPIMCQGAIRNNIDTVAEKLNVIHRNGIEKPADIAAVSPIVLPP